MPSGVIKWGDEQQAKEVAGTALLRKLFDLLDIVGSGPGSVTIAELSEATGWPRATLYRILAAATSKGYVRQDSRGHAFTLGFRFIELAQNVWSSADIVTAASGELRRLRDITGETAYLAIFHETATLALGKFESAHPHRSAGRLGVRRPLHATSQGKAILGHLPPADAAALIAKLTLESYTPRTMTDPNALIAHLGVIRQRGYAIDDEELIPGMRCVGAPILDHAGMPIGAISISGPIYRVTVERVEQLGPEIAQTARDIEFLLRRPTRSTNQGNEIASAHPGNQEPAYHGTAPLIDAKTGMLYWLDKLAPTLNATAQSTSTLRPSADIALDSLLDAGDRLIAFGGGRAMAVSKERMSWQQNIAIARPIVAIGIHPGGTVYGAAYSEETGTTTVGRLEADATVQPSWVLQGEVSSLAWDPTGHKLFAASPKRGVVYLIAESSPARVFARISKASGEPCGLATDLGGHVWVALYDGWSLARLTELGEFDQVIALPVPRPTGLAFGVDDPNILHVTTSRIGLAREVLENATLSGRLLSVKSGCTGWTPPSAKGFQLK